MGPKVRLVIKLGGSVIFSQHSLSKEHLTAWIDLLADICDSNKVVTVVGGGSFSKQYIQWARNLGLTEYECDMIGIIISRINARILARLAKLRHPNIRVCGKIPEGPEEVLNMLDTYDIVFCGGFMPGQSTIGVAAEVAEAIGSRYLLVATDVDGVYDRDPKIHRGAVRLRRTSIADITKQFVLGSHKAGTYKLFDTQSLKILERSKIICVVFNGLKLHVAKKVISLVLQGDIRGLEDLSTIVLPSPDR